MNILFSSKKDVKWLISNAQIILRPKSIKQQKQIVFSKRGAEDKDLVPKTVRAS